MSTKVQEDSASLVSANGNTLSAAQQEIVECGLLTTGFHCILQMPTGGGKTWLAETAIESTLQSGRKAIYLTPLRALAEELLPRWRRRFDGFSVGVYTGDYSSGSYPVPFRDAQLLIMTPERLDACTRAWRHHWHWIPQLDLVVVDELHLLGDERRGPRLEGALSRIRRLNPFLRVLGLSATLGNRRELARWLDGVEYASSERPITLQWRIARYHNAADKPLLLENELRRALDQGGQSLVFVQSRRRAEALAQRLQTVGIGAVHHHAGLARAERRTAEAQFRQRKIPVLVATATLEMGLNLPVRQVVLYDLQEFDGVDFTALKTNTVWQRVGRAGRHGLDTEGEAVLLAPQWDRTVDRYAEGCFEPIRSGFADTRALAEQVLVEVASGLARTPGQVEAVMARSLAAQQRILPNVRTLIEQMCKAGMLVEHAEDDAMARKRAPRHLLSPTLLGRVATRHFLLPASLVLLRCVLEVAPDATYFDVLLALCCTLDCAPRLPADYEELEFLSEDLAAQPSVLLAWDPTRLSELLGVSGKRLLTALKTALAVWHWTVTGRETVVAERYGAYAFEVERLVESLDRLLLALNALWSVGGEEGETNEPAYLPAQDIPVGAEPLPVRLRALQVMVRAGIDEEAATLTLVPGIGPALARRLAGAGISDIEALAQAEGGVVAATVRGVRNARALQWTEAAQALVAAGGSAYQFRNTPGTPRGAEAAPRAMGWPTELDPYRLRRALDLRVSGGESGVFRVVGGTEPHLVRLEGQTRIVCDCLDAARGQTLCKHVLALRLYRGDMDLQRLARQLEGLPGEQGGELDLYALWFEGGLRNGPWGGRMQ